MISSIALCLVLAVFGGAQQQGYPFSWYSQRQQVFPSPVSAPLLLLPKEYLVKTAANSPYQQFGAPAALTSSQQFNTFNRQPMYQQTFGQLQQASTVSQTNAKYTAKQQKEDSAKQSKKSQEKENDEVVQQQNNDNLSEESSRLTQEETSPQLYKAPIYFISQQFYSTGSQFGQLNQQPPKTLIKEATTTEAAAETTTEVDDATTTEATTEKVNANLEDGNDDAENVENSEGLYYLLLPDGKLQKIVYMTKEDLKKMQLSANIQYQNVEPIVGPIYSFNPANSPFSKVL